jgi:hypothetical protein
VLSGIGVPITVDVGYLLIGMLMAVGLVSYYLGQRRVSAGTYDWESPAQKLIRLGLRRGDPTAAEAAAELGIDPTTALQGGPTPPPPPPPAPPAPSPVPAWEPPKGFVSRPLGDETDVGGASTWSTALPAEPPTAPAPPPAPALFDGEAQDATVVDAPPSGPGEPDHDQPTLPLDFGDPLVDPTLIDEEPPDDADPLFAEPRWRDSPR